MIKTILLILITIFIPPLGVFLIAGCGMDLFINILLTILGYFPGHIHAFYIEYVYYTRRDQARSGALENRRAPGVYSERVQRGGRRHGRNTTTTTAVPVGAPVGGQQHPGVVGGAPYQASPVGQPVAGGGSGSGYAGQQQYGTV